MINPDAYFDTVYALAKGPRSLRPLSVSELHMFTYLACVVSLVEGNAISEWGYPFYLTDEGFPYSQAVAECIEELSDMSYLSVLENSDVAPSFEKITAEADSLATLSVLSSRKKFLDAALECALIIPRGSIRHAINKSPGVEVAQRRNQITQLLLTDDVDVISDEYRQIDKLLDGQYVDLMDPAVIWLTARISERPSGQQ